MSKLENYRIPLPAHTKLAYRPSSDSTSATSSTQNGSEQAASSVPFEGHDDPDGGFFYIRDFITEEEEQFLLEKIRGAPQPKWRNLQNRRLQHWGGQMSAKGILIPQPLPDFMTKFPPLQERISSTGAFEGSKHSEFNHCLVNEYLPGQGISPHEDGKAYYPAVATLSLGSHGVLDVYRYASEYENEEQEKENKTEEKDGEERPARPRERDPVFSFWQERRSLLITRGWAYKNYLHGISERTSDSASSLQRVPNGFMVKDAEAISHLRRGLDSNLPSTNSDISPHTIKTKSGQEVMEIVEPSLERGTRISMTFRDVERVSKGLGGVMKGLMGGQELTS